MKRTIKPYNVIIWNFNHDDIEYYDVMPYLIGEYKKIPAKNRPKDREGIREFLLRTSRYQFWSRCQYEVIITGWPKQKRETKVDVYDQLEKNIEVLTDHFMSHL